VNLIIGLVISAFTFAGFPARGDVTFPKQTLRLSGNIVLKVEVATTVEQKSQGLMLRTKLKDGEGMLFVFPHEEILSFWMKNTLIPLSIGFFDKKKNLIEVLDMDPVIGPVRDEQLPRYQSSHPAMYALEVPKGWFAKKKIAPPAHFSLSK
jgi:uncharacterized protein